MELRFASGNANKLADIGALLAPHDITIRKVELDLPEIQGSIEEVSLAKARAAGNLLGGPVLVEDTALCFNALNGLPGPYIKWFLKAGGPEGLYPLLQAYGDKTAMAVGTLGFSSGPGHEPVIFRGTEKGCIVSDIRGSRQFGWHTAFQPENSTETYAEMAFEDPKRIRHLQRAVQAFVDWLKENNWEGEQRMGSI